MLNWGAEMPKDDLRMIVRVCRMYYLQDLTQAEIARQLFISRPQVCKLISRAKEINVISIHINDPFSEESKLSVALKERYRLSDAVVINLQGSEGTEALEALAKNLSILLSGYVSNGNMVAVFRPAMLSRLVRPIRRYTTAKTCYLCHSSPESHLPANVGQPITTAEGLPREPTGNISPCMRR